MMSEGDVTVAASWPWPLFAFTQQGSSLWEAMEKFSMLTISGPNLSCFALKGAPDSTHSVQTTSLPDYLLNKLQSNECQRQKCTIYRPWYSPYSYFVRTKKESQGNTCSFPDALRSSSEKEVPADSGQAGETPDSASSSSGTLEKARPRDCGRKAAAGKPAPESCITFQDILLASKWQPQQQNGHKCMACCRMFPTVHSLKTHIKCGSKEGFSCKVYYHKLKVLCEKEQKSQPKSQPSNHPAASGSSKMLK